MKTTSKKLNSSKPGMQNRIRRAAIVLGTLSLLSTGVATAGGFSQVKPFEYATNKSESLTSLYAQWEPIETSQQGLSKLVLNNPLTPSLIPQLRSSRRQSINLRSFSTLDSGGYYLAASSAGTTAGTVAGTILGLVLYVGIQAGNYKLNEELDQVFSKM